MLLKKAGLLLGTGIPLVILLYADFGQSFQIVAMAAVAVMMSIFWVTEAIPLAATALLPIGLFPLLGIADSKSTGSQYMNSIVFLLIGGFMIALAMQRWNLHKRIALSVLALFGGRPSMLLLGFVLATAGLSMWISNTATTLMMLPIAMAVLSRYRVLLTPEQEHRFTIGLLLSIAYSASIGGMMTLVGTAPNLVFARFYEVMKGDSVGFLQWMLLSVPIGVILLIAMVLMMKILFFRQLPSSDEMKQVVIEEKAQLGRMRYEEKVVLLLFIVTATLWMTRKGLDLGEISLHGWADHILFGNMVDDGSVAIAMAVILFFIPARRQNGLKTTILDEQVFSELPWSVVILFGGGFALAYGFSESGLSSFIATQLNELATASLPVLILWITAGMSLLTELTSNTATTQLVLPILESAASVTGIPAVWYMLPATLAASCAFMFPVATPPNAIVFGSGKIRVIDMVLTGITLNVFAVLLISLMTNWLLPGVFQL